MKAKLVTYDTKGNVIEETEVIGFICGGTTEALPEEKTYLYFGLPPKNSKKGFNQNVFIKLDDLFGEVTRKLRESKL